MVYRVGVIRRILEAWPGKRLLGNYRFLPLFFILGASLEFSMINWQVGETNFYRTFKKRKAQDIIEISDFRKIYPAPEIGVPSQPGINTKSDTVNSISNSNQS